jgi:DNA replication and repair protein RecF
LLQRNNLLKSRLSPSALDDSLFVWDIKFAELASAVTERRIGLINTISASLGRIYSSIADKKSSVAVQYSSSVPAGDYQANALRLLRHKRHEDERRGYTTVGPHRDDFSFMLNDAPVEVSASRGEMRTLLLSLKVVELTLVAAESGHKPILLLDDVFSELDPTRRKALAELAKSYQTVITTTDLDDNFTKELFNEYKLITTG